MALYILHRTPFFLETCLGRRAAKALKFAGESGGSAFANVCWSRYKVSDLAAALRRLQKHMKALSVVR